MAVIVVDAFEVVEVDEADTQGKVAAGAAIDLTFELVTRALVGQAAGETVATFGREQPVERCRVLQAERDQRGIRLRAPERQPAVLRRRHEPGDQTGGNTGWETDRRRGAVAQRR